LGSSQASRPTANPLIGPHGLGTARAIENLLSKGKGFTMAVADQFGDPGYTRDSLMARGKRIGLKQTKKAERGLAVAASILARGSFLYVAST